MELKEAILAVDREYNADVKGFFASPEREHHTTIGVIEDSEQIRESGILEKISRRGLDDVALIIALRFGMRVQRKLDHPERVTTYRHTDNQLGEEQLDEIRRLFLAAWEGTSDHLNLVALRLVLGLDKLVPLPADTDLTPMLEEMTKEQAHG